MGAVPGAVGHSRFRPAALPIRVVAGMALLASTLGGPSTASAVDIGPPTILFAGEIGTAPSYDHVIVVYDERLDESVTPSAVNFRVEIDGVDYTPDAVTFLLSGLPNLGDPFDPGGATFLQHDLPAPATIGPATTTLSVTYTPGVGPNPIRDLSLTEAEFVTLAGDVVVTSFGPLVAIVDSDHGANRVALVFLGQIDLGSIPLPGEFVVTVTPFGGVAGPATVIGVEAVHPDVGLGILDLVLASPIRYNDSVEVSYNAPGTSVKSRNETGVTAGPFSGPVLVLLPVNIASGTGSATTATPGGFPTVADPVATTVTSPSGGAVSIDEVPIDPAPPGYTFFGEQVEVTAPPAAGPATPLVLRFEIDASLIPLGQTYLSAVVLRNDVPIPACTGPPGQAVPTPCVSLRELITGGGGDIAITVLTVEASTYNFAIVPPYAFSGLKWPVASAPTRNKVVAGLPIPLRFSLSGDRGLGVFGAGYPASGTVSCTFAAPPATLLKTVASLGLPLHYTTWNDTYLYVWQTDRAWRGTCRTLVISFADGTSAQAFFDFRR